MIKPIFYMVITSLALLLCCANASTSKQFYGKELCNYPGFTCIKLRRSDTWDSLFKSRRDRELVKRLNRTNMPLYMRSWLVVPTNLKEVNHLALAPFVLHYNTEGKRLIVVSLAHHAFGAYNKDGTLVHWGPVSGGKDYCKDVGGPCKTITGNFRINRKDSEECRSGQFPVDTKGGAPMPYCMHFYRGIAIHGSTLPGYHASHGCVRLFFDDAKWLNENFAKVGTKVMVTDDPRHEITNHAAAAAPNNTASLPSTSTL